MRQQRLRRIKVSVAKKFVPTAAVGALIVAGAVALPLQASAVTLPEITAEELIALLDSEVTGFSGTVTKTTDLGLPAMEMSSLMSKEMVDDMASRMPDGFEDFIPQVLEQNLFTEAISFLAGTDTIRIYASEDGFRAQILDPMSQRDIVITESQLWSYNASTQTALTRTTTGTVDHEQVDAAILSMGLDASDLRAIAEYLLADISADTSVFVGDDHRIAGRTAYRLIVEPQSEISLISSIQVSVDSENGMPLGVTVFSTQQDAPAVAVAFTSISFETPNASMFQFTPPPGTTVENLELPEAVEEAVADWEAGALTVDNATARGETLVDELAEGATTAPIGERWDTVITMDQLPADIPLAMFEQEIFQDLFTEVAGGKVFSTPLVNVLLTDDGAVFAGAVTIAHLVSLASR